MLQIRDIDYRIGQVQILRQLNLSIGRAQYFALAGVNGAGKSTLIRIILDLISNIEQGRILVDGIDHRSLAARQLIAYLPEKFDVRKEVSGWQYLKFIAGIYQRPLNRDRVEELSGQLDLDFPRLDDRSGDYSKGMRQKLGLISCFMLDTPLIILDEPLTGLDPKARYSFKRLLVDERQRQRTIFYSTHMLADAEEISDRFGILHQGRIVFEGSPQQCLDSYQSASLEQAYMNCIGAQGQGAGV